MRRLIVLLLLYPLLVPSAQADSVDAQLKAALLYRFTQFSQWADVPPIQQDYCIAGDTHVFNALSQMLQEPDERITLLTSAGQAANCTVLYLSAELVTQPDWTLWLQQPNRLTVVEGAELFRRGAIIGLIAEPQRISFRVNLTLARQNGFHLSAHMLKLAKEIH